MPGHLLLVTNGPSGGLYSSVELARRLSEAGHRVTLNGPPRARDLVERQRLTFLELKATGYEEFLDDDAGIGWVKRWATLSHRRRLAVRSTAALDWARTVRELDPDLLLIDGEMHEHIIAAADLGVPIALLNTFVSIWRRPGLPPPHHLVRPGIGWWGTAAGIWLLWRALRLRKRGKRLTQWLRRAGCDRVSILRELARGVGFDLGRQADASQWLIPFTYRHFPVLSLHALEFEFPHSPAEHVHYVGPMILDSRFDRPASPTTAASLEAILARRHADDAHRLIYAGFGSVFSTDLDLLRRLIAAVAQRRDWQLILSLAHRGHRVDLGELPANVQAFDWLPQLDVLRNSDACVTHGGINTIDECVWQRVPMLVYCGGETDMAGNTARVAHWQIGIAGDRRGDGAATIRGHLERLLVEGHFQENLNRLQAAYRSYAQQRIAERVIESLLVSRSPTPPRRRIPLQRRAQP